MEHSLLHLVDVSSWLELCLFGSGWSARGRILCLLLFRFGTCLGDGISELPHDTGLAVNGSKTRDSIRGGIFGNVVTHFLEESTDVLGCLLD